MANNGYNSNGDPIYSGTGAPASGADMTEVAAYAGTRGNSLIGTTTERTSFAYPKPGLLWYDTTLSLVYIYQGTSWVVHSTPGMKRTYLLDASVDNISTAAQSLGSISFGTASVARRIVIDIIGSIGFSSVTTAISGMYVDATNGTLVRQGNFDDTVNLSTVGAWYPYGIKRILDVAAGANASIVIRNSLQGSGNAYFRLTADCRVLLTGEY